MSQPRKSRNVCYSEWGRLICCGTCLFLPPVGFMACFYDDNLSIAAGVYSVIISILIYPFVYPVEKLGKALQVPRNFLLWGAILLLCSSFLWFSPPTILGGAGFVISGVWYIVGALIGEKYQAPRAPAGG